MRSRDPAQIISALYNSFGLSAPSSVHSFLENHSSSSAGIHQKMFHSYKSDPFLWQRDMEHSEVLATQKTCQHAMIVWGYKSVKKNKGIKLVYDIFELDHLNKSL